MTKCPLTDEELWVLRRIDRHCKFLGMENGFIVHRFDETKFQSPAVKEILDKMKLGLFDRIIQALESVGLIEARFVEASVRVGISAKGRMLIHDLDNPDLVEKWKEHMLRHPCWARVMIWHLVVGPVVTLVVAILSIIALVVSLYY